MRSSQLALASLLLAAGLACGEGEDPPLVEQAEGYPAVGEADTVTVVDVEARTLSVDTRQGPQTYRIREDTRIVSEGDALALSDLEPGQRVVVTAGTDGRVATEVVVVAVAEEPPPGPVEPRY